MDAYFTYRHHAIKKNLLIIREICYNYSHFLYLITSNENDSYVALLSKNVVTDVFNVFEVMAEGARKHEVSM